MSINYFLNTKYINSNFAVPNVIVDDYIRSADGDYIKILLIILRISLMSRLTIIYIFHS